MFVPITFLGRKKMIILVDGGKRESGLMFVVLLKEWK